MVMLDKKSAEKVVDILVEVLDYRQSVLEMFVSDGNIEEAQDTLKDIEALRSIKYKIRQSLVGKG